MNLNATDKITDKIDDTPLTITTDKIGEVESEIREFIKSDVAYLRRPVASNLHQTYTPDSTVANVNSLIQRVAGGSLAEIDRLVNELDSLRDMLHSEGQRVQREIAGYAQLSQTAMKSTRIITENMAQWRKSLNHDSAPPNGAAAQEEPGPNLRESSAG